MPRCEEIKIRERTNLYDLLDDGVENGSDLSELSELKAGGATAPDSSTQPHGQSNRSIPPAYARRSIFGVFLGLALTAVGSAAATWPQEMIVWHHRILYLPTVTEHVSTTTARWYAIVVAAAGLLVLAASLVRMRVSRPRP